MVSGVGVLAVAIPGPAGVAPAGAAPSGPVMIVGSFASNDLLTFPVPSNGNIMPSSKLEADPARNFSSSAYDAQGDLWGCITTSSAIDEFTPSQLAAGGTQAPHNAIDTNYPSFVTFDGSGDLWVTSYETNKLMEFTPSQLAAGGTQTPAVTITSDTTTPRSLVRPAGMAFDAAGDLWVSQTAPASLVEFTPTQLKTTGAPKPKVFLYGTRTDLVTPRGMAFDTKGNLWVSSFGSQSLAKFSPAALAAGGNQAPATTITYALTWQPAFDTKGNLWVTDATLPGSVAEWTPAQQAAGGTLVPNSLIDGTNTGFNTLTSLSISAAPTLTSVTPAAGVAGTTVTVHGTGFTSATTVHFGAKAATTVKDVSPFTLTAKVPPGGGTVTVTASTWAGTSGPEKFTYKLTGYDLAGSDGGVFVFPVGQASGFYGSLPGCTWSPPPRSWGWCPP